MPARGPIPYRSLPTRSATTRRLSTKFTNSGWNALAPSRSRPDAEIDAQRLQGVSLANLDQVDETARRQVIAGPRHLDNSNSLAIRRSPPCPAGLPHGAVEMPNDVSNSTMVRAPQLRARM
jgi:hypothetical protein